MNFVRKFIGATPTDVVSLIPSGKLFLTRSPCLPKGALECLYNDAMISVKKTTTRHYYQLSVIKAYEEGEANLQSDENDDDDSGSDSDSNDSRNSDEKLFVLAPDLRVKVYSKHDGTRVISWRDLTGDIGDRFEFVVDEDVKYTDVDSFMLALYKCLYELKYQKSAASISSMTDLSEFVYDPAADSDNDRLPLDRLDSLQSLRKKNFPSLSRHSFADSDDAADSTDPEYDNDVFKDASTVPLYLFKRSLHVSGDRLVLANVELRCFDPDNDVFARVSPLVNISIVRGSSGVFLLSDTPQYSFQAPLRQEMNPSFNFDAIAFIFNHYEYDSAYSFLLRFSTAEDFNNFQTVFFAALFEAVAGPSSSATMNQNDKEYMEDAFGKLSIHDSEDEEDSADEYSEAAFASAKKKSREDENSDDEESDDDQRLQNILGKTIKDKSQRKFFVDEDSEDEYGDNDDQRRKQRFYGDSTQKNSGLSTGLANDRSYVSRGDRIGVFKQGNEDLEYITSIKNMKDLNNRNFVPNKMMLHQRDNALIMSNTSPLDSKLYKMDLAKGQIVEEWEADEDEKLEAFAPVSKFAPLTNEQLLTGVTSNSMFRIDPRLSGKKVVKDKTFKQYKTKKNGFDTIAVTQDGYIAVGSNDGGIRLYDKLGMNAKTALPALGEGFVGLDVSKDGRWLLATCKTYILLIDLKIGSGQKNAGSVGFEKYFDADKKPIPKRLTLKPEHVAHIARSTNGKGLDFTRAVFNTSLQSKETTIVASTGPYVVSWSLSELMRKKDPQVTYTIFKYLQDVVADSFLFNSQDEVITALKDDARMLNKKLFKKAAKSTL